MNLKIKMNGFRAKMMSHHGQDPKSLNLKVGNVKKIHMVVTLEKEN